LAKPQPVEYQYYRLFRFIKRLLQASQPLDATCSSLCPK